MSPFWIILEITVMEVVVTTGAIRRAKHHLQPTPNFYRLASPNHQCQSTVSMASVTNCHVQKEPENIFIS